VGPLKPLLLFDMDGTLIILKHRPKYRGTITHHTPFMSIKVRMKEIAVSHGVPVEEVKDMNRMAYIWNRVRSYLEEDGRSQKEIQDIIYEINGPFMVQERSEHDLSVLLPGTLSGLYALKSMGYEMGLVTTASRKSYDRLSTSDDFGRFGDFFSLSITRDDCDYIKPDPEPINRMMELCGRDDVVYVGDSDHDALAAKAAGARFVLINTRDYDEETINSFSTDGVIDNLSQLPELLNNLP
jgi:phosphoglycolate phosphatase-like HAD superfamily hydrolase